MKLAIGAAWVAGLLEMAALWRSRARSGAALRRRRIIALPDDSGLKRLH